MLEFPKTVENVGKSLFFLLATRYDRYLPKEFRHFIPYFHSFSCDTILSRKTHTSFVIQMNAKISIQHLTFQTAIAGCYYIPEINCQRKLIKTKLEICSYSFIPKDMSKIILTINKIKTAIAVCSVIFS